MANELGADQPLCVSRDEAKRIAFGASAAKHEWHNLNVRYRFGTRKTQIVTTIGLSYH